MHSPSFLELPPRQGALGALSVAFSLPLAYAGRWDQWLGVWSETQRHLGTAFIFAMPVAAAVGAFVGATTARNGMDALRRASGRHRWQVQLRPVVELAVWVCLGYLLGAIPALVATAVDVGHGAPRLSPFLAQLACVGAVSALGQAVGSRMPWFLGTPIAAATTYVVLSFLSYRADSLLVSLTPIDERRVTFEPIKTWVLVTQTLFWLSIIAYLVCRRAGQRETAAAVLVSVGQVASPLLYVTPDTRGLDASAARLECARTSTSLTLCLPTVKDVVREKLAPELDRAAGSLSGLLPPDAAFIDDEAATVSPEIDRDIALTEVQQKSLHHEVIRLSKSGDVSAYSQIDTDEVHFGLIAYLAPQPSSKAASPSAGDAQDLQPRATPTDVLWRWYLTTVGAPIDGSGRFGGPVLDQKFLDYGGHQRELNFFSRLDATERTAWFKRHAASIGAGKLGWTAFRPDGS